MLKYIDGKFYANGRCIGSSVRFQAIRKRIDEGLWEIKLAGPGADAFLETSVALCKGHWYYGSGSTIATNYCMIDSPRQDIVGTFKCIGAGVGWAIFQGKGPHFWMQLGKQQATVNVDYKINGDWIEEVNQLPRITIKDRQFYFPGRRPLSRILFTLKGVTKLDDAKDLTVLFRGQLANFKVSSDAKLVIGKRYWVDISGIWPKFTEEYPPAFVCGKFRINGSAFDELDVKVVDRGTRSVIIQLPSGDKYRLRVKNQPLPELGDYIVRRVNGYFEFTIKRRPNINAQNVLKAITRFVEGRVSRDDFNYCRRQQKSFNGIFGKDGLVINET